MYIRLGIFIIVALFLFVSCNRIKDKGKDVVAKTEQKIKNKSKDLKNILIPIFDSDRADTKYNKQRFKEFIKIELTPDIKNIYCWGDFLGVDYSVQFSFSCDPTTIKKIIEKKGLTLNNEDNYNLAFSYEFDWWKKEEITKMKPYMKDVNGDYWQYLWYDKTNSIAYYNEYSI